MKTDMAKQRTSFALDEETIRLLQHLAGQWRVSQAEVVRRAVRLAVEQDWTDTVYIRQRLAEYQDAGRITAEAADEYLGDVAADRAGWERGGAS